MSSLTMHLVAAALLAGAAVPAAASDMLNGPLPVHPWTGFYAGLHAGATLGVVDWEDFGGDVGTVGDLGASVGGHLGYLHQVTTGIVIGAEASLIWIGLETPEEDKTMGFFRSDWVAALSGRAGVLTAPQTLVYAKAGVAWIDGQVSPDTAFSNSDTLIGGQVGMGVESALTDRVSLRAEALYTWSGDEIDEGSFSTATFQPKYLSFLLGASYRLGGASGGMAAAEVEQARGSWNGFYVGLQAGGSFGQTVVGQPFSLDTGPAASMSPTGGLYAGYSHEVYPNIVGALEIHADILDHQWDVVPEFPGDDNGFLDGNWMMGVAARAGYLVTPNTQLYGRLGWALLDVDQDLTSDFPTFAVPTDVDPLNAVQVGFGMEHMLTANVLLRLEGLYVSALEDAELDAGNYSASPDLLMARAGVAYKF